MSQPPIHDHSICARGGMPGPSATHPSAPPLYMTAAFDIDGPGQADDLFHGRQKGYIYSRVANPNIDAFSADVAALEGAALGVSAASGMGILSALLMATVKSGDHVLAVGQLYGVTGALLERLHSQFGVEVGWVDDTAPASVAAALRPDTKLALVESVSNPTLHVADLPAIAGALGGAAGVPLVVDATFSPPPLLRSLQQGGAVVWHSATKFLNGHGDVTLGVLAGPADLVKKVRQAVTLFGFNPSPAECWLASRGLRTLPLRVTRASATALELARFLASRPEVAAVHYPGLPTHPSHATAARLLEGGFGPMLAFEPAAGTAAVAPLFKALSAVPFSPTLGDARTTVSYPLLTSHRSVTPAKRAAWGISDALVRVSVGLEEPSVLLREFGTALEAAHAAAK